MVATTVHIPPPRRYENMRENCVICFETVEGFRQQYHGCQCQVMIHPYCKDQWDGVYPGNVCPLCRKKSPIVPTNAAPVRKVHPVSMPTPVPVAVSSPIPSAPTFHPVTVFVTEGEYYSLQGSYPPSPTSPMPVLSVPTPSAPTAAQVFRHPIRCNPIVAGVTVLLILLIIYLAYLWSHA